MRVTHLKLILTICLLVVAMSSISVAQQSQPASLTRSQIKEAETRLSELGYWTGPVDGIFDSRSRFALVAFQKYQGRTVTSKLTVAELQAIREATSPQAKETGYAHVEIDVERQVLMFINDKGGVRVLAVSTGNDKTFVTEGQTSIAYTPRGRFLVYEKEIGWGAGPLGAMYYSNFISGGVAIHGSPDVPTQPASHGCIRVPMFAARQVSKLMPLGTIVLVYDHVSFVSGKAWAENAALKQAALAAITTNAYDYGYEIDATQTRPRTVIKKPRSRIIRA